jgi:hypothetical protein
MRPYPELANRAWLRVQYVSKGRSGPDIAADLGCSRSTVYEALARNGIARRPPSLRSERPQLDDRKWLRRAYVTEKRSSRDIAAEIGCQSNTVPPGPGPTWDPPPPGPAAIGYRLTEQSRWSISALGVPAPVGPVRRGKARRSDSQPVEHPPPARRRNDDRWRVGGDGSARIRITHRDATVTGQASQHRAVAVHSESPRVYPHGRRAVRTRLGVDLTAAFDSPFGCTLLPRIHAVHIGQHRLAV